MRHFHIFAPLAIFCTVTACAPSQTAQTGAIAIGRTFGEGTVTFENQRGSLSYIYTIANFGGVMAVCGSYLVDGPVRANVARELLSQLKFFVDGRPIHKGFSHFRQVNGAAELKSRPAQCLRTTRPWSEEFLKGEWNVDLEGPNRITV